MEQRFEKFWKVLKDTPHSWRRLEFLGRIGAYLLELCEKLPHRKNFEHKPCQIPSYRGCYTGANGNGILIFLKVHCLRRNYNFHLELEKACPRSFYDGATFWKVLKDTPHSWRRLEFLGRIRAYLLELCEKLLHRKSFERKPCQIPSWIYYCAAKYELFGKLRYRSH